jgi:hypothetical protein
MLFVLKLETEKTAINIISTLCYRKKEYLVYCNRKETNESVRLSRRRAEQL